MHLKTHHPGYSWNLQVEQASKMVGRDGHKAIQDEVPGFGLQPGCVGKIPTLQRCHATLPDPGRALRVFDHLSHGTVGPGRSGEVSASRRCFDIFR